MALEVHLVTPEEEVWGGEASMVIAHGTEGDVGILAGHAPMLIRLAVGPLRVQHAGGEEIAVVDGGFMHVTSEGDSTRVDVLATEAELASEIDLEEARRRKELAEQRLSEEETDEARRELERADARLSVAGA